jgi:hypothetical protein
MLVGKLPNAALSVYGEQYPSYEGRDASQVVRIHKVALSINVRDVEMVDNGYARPNGKEL